MLRSCIRFKIKDITSSLMLLCLYMVWYEIIQVLILLFKLVWFCPLFVLVMRFHSLSFLPSVKVSFRYYWFEVKTLKSNPRLLVFDKENSEYYFSCVSPLYQDYSGKWSIFPFIESLRHTSWWLEKIHLYRFSLVNWYNTLCAKEKALKVVIDCC